MGIISEVLAAYWGNPGSVPETNHGVAPCWPRPGQILRAPARHGLLVLVACTLGVGGGQQVHAQSIATNSPSERTAVAVARLATNGSIARIVVTDGGAGYTTNSPPLVAVSGGGGSGALATAVVNNGAVNQITILSPGSGYTNAPAVFIDPPPPPLTPAALTLSLMPVLSVAGQPLTAQEIQYADALGNTNQWLTLTNIVLGNSPYLLLLGPIPPATQRLYRAVARSASGPDPARWIWIAPRTFTLGSPSTEYDRSNDEGPQTVVTFTQGYWMARYEVTQGEYSSIMATNPAGFAADTNQPVENVTWYQANTYCALLTLHERAAGRVPAGYEYRLATEAEWECAVRADTTTRFPFGDDHDYTLLDNYAWYLTNSAKTTHDIGTKLPNPWGLFDMEGNVFEWCADWYGPYPGGSVIDPTGPASGANRCMRGGNWRFPGGDARSAARNFNAPDFSGPGIGIRVVLGPIIPAN